MQIRQAVFVGYGVLLQTTRRAAVRQHVYAHLGGVGIVGISLVRGINVYPFSVGVEATHAHAAT